MKSNICTRIEKPPPSGLQWGLMPCGLPVPARSRSWAKVNWCIGRPIHAVTSSLFPPNGEIALQVLQRHNGWHRPGAQTKCATNEASDSSVTKARQVAAVEPVVLEGVRANKASLTRLKKVRRASGGSRHTLPAHECW